MSLYFECQIMGKQVKVEDSKGAGRVNEFVSTRKIFQTPAYIRGTKQEVSTFLLNNQERSFSSDGATLHYACYTHSPLGARKRAYSPLSAGVFSPIPGLEMLVAAGEGLVGAVKEAFDAHTVELVVSQKEIDVLDQSHIKHTEAKVLTFHDLVPIVWG